MAVKILTDEKKEAMRKMVDDGLTTDEIMSLVGASRCTVCSFRQKYLNEKLARKPILCGAMTPGIKYMNGLEHKRNGDKIYYRGHFNEWFRSAKTVEEFEGTEYGEDVQLLISDRCGVDGVGTYKNHLV